MNILAINSSYRGDKGHTRFLIGKLFQGAKAAGAECQVVTLTRLKINRCLACGKCQTVEHYLKCVHDTKDDVMAAFHQMSRADIVVYATPVYVFGLSGLLKLGYNVQISTEKQFVVGFSVHQRPGDSGCLVPHLKRLKAQLGRLPKKVIADAGYGSEENYDYLDEQGLEAYVKYNTFHLEKKKRKKDRFRAASFPYDESKDEFTCPAEKRLAYQWTQPYQTENGFQTELRVYECEDCSGCELKAQCTRAWGTRHIRMIFRWRELREKASGHLLSEQGMTLRSKRPVEAESVFARLKHNWGFRRFLLRGKEKVEVEWGLLCIAHNLAKMAA